MATAPYLRRVSRSAPAACFTARPPPVGSPETVPYSPSSRELRIPAKEIAHSDLNRLFHDETEEWVVRLPVISKAGGTGQFLGRTFGCLSPGNVSKAQIHAVVTGETVMGAPG